jgi:23S rRNA (guanosine2251-2'-O)-methyltransferase
MSGRRWRDDRQNDTSDWVFGRWPVCEALKASSVNKVYLGLGSDKSRLSEILNLLKEKKVPFQWIPGRRLNNMIRGNHQGVVAQVAPIPLLSLKQLWPIIENVHHNGPRIIFLDGVQDPQNVGSILRSAAFFNIPAVVIPKRRSAPITSAVVRASAGAARKMAIAQVSNLAQAIEDARKKGLWLVGADMGGDDIRTADLPRPFALVLGSEGSGLHQLTRAKCDTIVGVKSVHPGVDSLNVGVACGILLHQLSN